MIRLYITYRAVLIRHCKYTAFILFTKEKQSFFQKNMEIKIPCYQRNNRVFLFMQFLFLLLSIHNLKPPAIY